MQEGLRCQRLRSFRNLYEQKVWCDLSVVSHRRIRTRLLRFLGDWHSFPVTTDSVQVGISTSRKCGVISLGSIHPIYAGAPLLAWRSALFSAHADNKSSELPVAARLMTTRLRSRMRRSSLSARIAGAYRGRASGPLAGDDPRAFGASGPGHGLLHPKEVTGLSQSSSGAPRWTLLHHFKSPSGLSGLNALDSTLGRSVAPAGIACQPFRRQQHTDEWLVQRALADRRRRQQARERARPNFVGDDEDGLVPRSNSESDYLLPETSEEEKLAGVLGRPDLIVTRNVEWANLAFGFEQQNKYVIMDPSEPQAPVGYILEDSNILMRQFLRRRRPFVAQVLDAYGNEICSVRRPIWLINSTIFVEVNGKVIGVAHKRWHLWKRVYDCYLGEKQFAAVENPGFWYWTFTLHDENQGVLGVIDRNWRGFGFEFLTDAGQYVVRFGNTAPTYAPSALRPQPLLEDVRVTGRPILSGSPTASNEMQNLQAAAQEAEGLSVIRSLSLSERAVVLALAVSLDNDYFSNHSSGFGFIPLPFFGGSEAADGVAPTESDAPENSESPHGSWAEDGTFDPPKTSESPYGSWAEDGTFVPPTNSESPDGSWAEDSTFDPPNNAESPLGSWADDGTFGEF